MKEYYRYIEPNGGKYKYVTAQNRDTALQMLSFLIEDSGHGSAEETYLALQEFEEIEYFEVPDNAHILYESEKNRICVSGTSEGPTYLSGTDRGWTQRRTQPMPCLFYVLPYKVFVVANSKEAALTKLFPIESVIRRVERKKASDEGSPHFRKIDGTKVEIHPFLHSKNLGAAYKELLPEGVTLISEPTLVFDRWSNYITGYLFRRSGHQDKFSEDQFNLALKRCFLSLYDLVSDELPSSDELCRYQELNRVIFEDLFPGYNACKRMSLADYKKLMDGNIDLKDLGDRVIGILTSTGEILEVDKETTKEIKEKNLGTADDYEVCDVKTKYKYVRVLRKIAASKE